MKVPDSIMTQAYAVIFDPSASTRRVFANARSIFVFYYKSLVTPFLLTLVSAVVLGLWIGYGNFVLNIAGATIQVPAAAYILFYQFAFGFLFQFAAVFPAANATASTILYYLHRLAGKTNARFTKILAAYTFSVMPIFAFAWIVAPIAGTLTSRNLGLEAALLELFFWVWGVLMGVYAFGNQLQVGRIRAILFTLMLFMLVQPAVKVIAQQLAYYLAVCCHLYPGG